jgi:hypothetical protein
MGWRCSSKNRRRQAEGTVVRYSYDGPAALSWRQEQGDLKSAAGWWELEDLGGNRTRIGAGASCTDGACGQVSRIIVNPLAREITHLVVDPRHQYGPGRLVPVDLVDATTGQIRLRCTLAEFQALRPAEETEVVPGLDPTGHAHQEARKQYRLGLDVA